LPLSKDMKAEKVPLLLFLLFIAQDLRAEESLSFLNRILSSEEGRLNKSYKRLSSGTRLLPDDPANYALYEKLKAHITALEAIIFSQKDMVSYYRTVDGFLEQIIDSLQRIRELLLKRSGVLYSGDNSEYVDLEIDQFYDHILYTLQNAEFNKKRIFEELLSDDRIRARFRHEPYYELGSVDRLLSFFIAQRTAVGASTRSLESRTRSLSVESENLSDFRSSVWDIDIGEEMQQLKLHHLLFVVNLLLL
jgi:flagellin-like hook-associated protein FlgL